MPQSEVVEHRHTTGTCPTCVRVVPACVVEEDGCVYLEKRCPDHGAQRALLSTRSDYFLPLMEAYFELITESYPQRDYILRLTARCNLHCPICLASSDDYEESDLALDQLLPKIDGRRRLKLDLMGAEATLHDELESIIRVAHERGHITALHTNGVRLRDEAYLERLLKAGLREIHLQCDGFSDRHDEIIRGEPMGEVKRRVLGALERRGVATDLVVTILRGVNESAAAEMLDYAAGHPFVKEVFYLGCRRLGRATEAFAESSVAPDELIDLVEDQTQGRINRDDLRVFQKLYFALLAVFKVRKCFYIHHYLVLRVGGGYRPVADYMDLAYLEPRLDRFRRIFRRSRALSVPYLFFHGAVSVLRKRGFALVYHAIVLQMILWLGFDLSRIRRDTLLLGFITACDPWIHDTMIAANCGKGEISNDLGTFEAGADANVARERNHRAADSLADTAR